VKKFIFLLVFLSWSVTLFFWFNNVDISYINGYIGFIDPLKNFNLLNIIRGHMLTQFFVYIFFGLRAWPYYFIANIFHSVAAVISFCIFYHFFKNKEYSLFATLAIFINVSYADALFQGSFNQYYPLLLLLFLLSVLVFVKEKYLWIAPSVFMFLGLLFRETMILVPVIFLIYLISTLNKKYIFSKLKYFVPTFMILALYFFLRAKYLGVLSSDLTDDAVQLRMSYMQSGRYLQLLFLIVINLFRLVSEQFFTFPIIYNLREIFFDLIKNGSLRQPNPSAYLISLSGLFVFSFLTLWLYFSWKKNPKDKLTNFAIFGYLWFVTMNSFIAFVLPFPTYLWSGSYGFDKVISRYNYWGIWGLGVLLFSLLFKYRKKNNFYYFLSIYIFVNLGLIWMGGTKLYREKHSQAKYFIHTVLNTYDSFPDKSVIYFNYFQVNNLRDYIYDLTFAFSKFKYPNTVWINEPTLTRLQKQNYNVDTIFAFDLDKNGYLVDKTQYLREQIKNQKLIDVDENLNVSNQFDLKQDEKVLSNFPYFVNFDARFVSDKNNSCDKDLTQYSSNRFKYLEHAKVEVASLYGSQNNYYPYVSAENMIDNQLHPDSHWQAELLLGESQVIVDLGETKAINGIGWSSDGKNSNPQSYDIYVSDDKQNWQKVMSVKDNLLSSRMDYFEKTKARYLKLDIIATLIGQPAMLRELDVQEYALNITKKYKEFNELYDDMLIESCMFDGKYWGKVLWITSNNTVKERVIALNASSLWNNYNIPVLNYEPYTNTRYILDDVFKSFIIEPFDPDVEFEVKGVKLIPWQMN